MKKDFKSVPPRELFDRQLRDNLVSGGSLAAAALFLIAIIAGSIFWAVVSIGLLWVTVKLANEI